MDIKGMMRIANNVIIDLRRTLEHENRVLKSFFDEVSESIGSDDILNSIGKKIECEPSPGDKLKDLYIKFKKGEDHYESHNSR